jgi:hypothetical protein
VKTIASFPVASNNAAEEDKSPANIRLDAEKLGGDDNAYKSQEVFSPSESLLDNGVASRENNSFNSSNNQININTAEELAKLFYNQGEILLYHYLYDEAKIAEFDPENKRVIIQSDTSKKSNNSRIRELLYDWTGCSWVLSGSGSNGDKTLLSQELDHNDNYARQAQNYAEIKYLLNRFPEAKIKLNNKPEGIE